MFTEAMLAGLQGGFRSWWDVTERKIVPAAILYLAQGCPDWGELGGQRNQLCSFCGLPNAAREYREFFFGGTMGQDLHAKIFHENLLRMAPPEQEIHTLMVFNAGSFLADGANAPETQEQIAKEVAAHPTIRRLVVEARSTLITEASLRRLTDILFPAGKALTIRIGVETQDERLRLTILKKGHKRSDLERASALMRASGVTSGGYVLLNPAPDLNPAWAREEALATIDWLLNPPGKGGLGMDEVYFCSANVAPNTPLAKAWHEGAFMPADLWTVFYVLRAALAHHGSVVHLLPFSDEPAFIAIPSNHVPGGVPQDLQGATGCDSAFHKMLARYRETMDPGILIPPECSCRPHWFQM